MKLTVVPDVWQHLVSLVVSDVVGEFGGDGERPQARHETLTLTVERQPHGWSVHASGLGDSVLEAGYSDVLEQALKRALP